MPGTVEERLKDFEAGIKAAMSTVKWTERNAPGFVEGWVAARQAYKEGVVPPFPPERELDFRKKNRAVDIDSTSRGAVSYHVPRAKERFEKEAAEAKAAKATKAAKKST